MNINAGNSDSDESIFGKPKWCEQFFSEAIRNRPDFREIYFMNGKALTEGNNSG
jgi:hypothetical protein